MFVLNCLLKCECTCLNVFYHIPKHLKTAYFSLHGDREWQKASPGCCYSIINDSFSLSHTHTHVFILINKYYFSLSLSVCYLYHHDSLPLDDGPMGKGPYCWPWERFSYLLPFIIQLVKTERESGKMKRER